MSTSIFPSTFSYFGLDWNKMNDTTTLSSHTKDHEEQVMVLGLISDSARQMVQTVNDTGVLPVLVLCGVTMNVLNMAVFFRQGLRDRVNLCLFSLAVSDTGFNVSYLASKIHAFFYHFNYSLGNMAKSQWHVFMGLYNAFLSLSTCLTVIISLERCVCVINPLKAKRLLSSRQMAIIILVLSAICLAGKGIGSFKYRTVEGTDPVTNKTVIITLPSEFYVNYRGLFHGIFDVAFNTIIPTISLVVVMTATVVIAVRMRTVLAWRKETAHTGSSESASSANQREAALTRMLVVVCVIYSACTIPSVVQAIVRSFVPEFGRGHRYGNSYSVSIVVTHLLEAVNCSVNFIVYYTMSTRFRQTLRELFRGGRAKHDGKESETRVSVMSASDDAYQMKQQY